MLNFMMNIWSHSDITDRQIVAEPIHKYAKNKSESTHLLLTPFVNGKTFLRYW